LSDQGSGREAAELLLDALQFSEDAAGSSPERFSWGVRYMDYPLDELRRLVLSGALAREDLSEVARELQLLDRHFPTARRYYLWLALATGQAFLESGSVENYLCRGSNSRLIPSARRYLFSQTWRYGFSERITMADAFDLDLRAARLQALAVGKPWAEEWETTQRVRRDREQSDNPIIVSEDAPYTGRESKEPWDFIRERRTQLRLLAMAAHFRSTGEVLELEDPFGSKLFHETTAIHLKAWSVGPDGVNDGGDGGWTHYPGGKDLVIEVDR
jgi:hypothetical protein